MASSVRINRQTCTTLAEVRSTTSCAFRTLARSSSSEVASVGSWSMIAVPIRCSPRFLQPLGQTCQGVLTCGLIRPDMRYSSRSRGGTFAHLYRAVQSIEVVIGSRVGDEGD